MEEKVRYPWIKELPKVDLHCHLDGSISMEIVKEFLKEEEYTEEELKQMLTAGEDCQSLTEYLEKFDIPLKCLQSPEVLEWAAYDLLKEASAENVKYIEMRYAPLSLLAGGMSCEEAIESAIRGMKRGEADFSIDSSLIICAMRHDEEAANKKLFETAAKYLDQGVCAVDLAGDESKYENARFASLFQYAVEKGIPFTIHSGECGNVENVKEAIAFGASRIGHGIAMRGDKETQALCVEKNIGIEMCPISNFQTKAVKSWEEYPFREFLEQKLCVTVNTDNRTVSGTSITRELEFLVNHADLNEKEAKILMENAINISFASQEIKDKLLK